MQCNRALIDRISGQNADQGDDSSTTPQAIEITLGTCNCEQPEKDFEPTVRCANLIDCKIGEYHKSCAGLANRMVPSGWLCVFCRPSHIKATKSSKESTQHHEGRAATGDTLDRISQRIDSNIGPALLDNEQPSPSLHHEQLQVIKAIEKGQNVFYTGSAGTGKSTVLKEFVSRLRQQGKHVSIVAPSGIAAINVNGDTVHSYAGWYPDIFKEPLWKLV